VAVSADQVVAAAKSKLGDQYVYGADGPSTFDCSGLMQSTFAQFGIKIPRTTEEQYKIGTAVGSAADLRAGDLVFTEGLPPGHVGMYVGGGQVIQAPHTGDVVRITPLADFGTITAMRRVAGLSYSTNDTIVGAVGESVQGLGNATAGTGFVSALGTVFNDVGGGLLSWPGQIIGTFSDVDEFAGKLYHNFQLFFQPSTWVRAGAGVFGFIFVIFGLVLLAREAKAGTPA
jgi:hypothetical protein